MGNSRLRGSGKTPEPRVVEIMPRLMGIALKSVLELVWVVEVLWVGLSGSPTAPTGGYHHDTVESSTGTTI